MHLDQVTIERIELLHPSLRNEARQIYAACVAALTGAYTVRFTHTFRSFSEQEHLYNQGRTKPGRVVTYARAGYSFHNYGLAVDICLLDVLHKQVSWDILKDYDEDGLSDWLECVAIFESYGWDWGGRWAKPKTDFPHFQKTFGHNIAGLLSLYKSNGSYYPRIV